MQVQSLGWEEPLKKEMATHSSIVAWKIPWTKEHGGLQSMGSQRVGRLSTTLVCMYKAVTYKGFINHYLLYLEKFLYKITKFSSRCCTIAIRLWFLSSFRII